MARQTVLGSQRSGLGSLIWLALLVGVAVFVVKDPAGAAAAAKGIFGWLVDVVDGIAAFIRNMAG